MRATLTALATMLALAATTDATRAQDADAGEKVFRKCKACHKVEDGGKGVGPHLFGIVGREVAVVEGYKYSDAMAGWAAEKAWDHELLAAFLENPRDVVDGTKMTFAGIAKEDDRKNLIAYLETLK